MDEPREDLAVTAERQLRLVGLLLILVGMSVTIVIERVAHYRARVAEERAKLLIKLEEPGSIITMAGISLLEASDSEKSPRR